MQYELVYSHGQHAWKSYNQDISISDAYADYIRSKPTLHPLRFASSTLNKAIAEVNQEGFPSHIKPGVRFYLDLRYFDESGRWYLDEVNLPNKDYLNYMYLCEYVKMKGQNLIEFKIFISEEHYNFNPYMARYYGSQLDLNPQTDVLIDWELCRTHPYLKGDAKAHRRKIH
jgi:hypothetical protein